MVVKTCPCGLYRGIKYRLEFLRELKWLAEFFALLKIFLRFLIFFYFDEWIHDVL